MTLFWLGIVWLAGIGLAPIFDLTTGEWLLLSLISLVSAILFRTQNTFRLLYLSILIFTLGAARYQSDLYRPTPETIDWYNDTDSYATITGLVIKSPDVRESYIGLQVDAETLRFGSPGSSYPVSGRILVRTSRFQDWSYGDKVLVQGFLETPPEYETFNYRDYLARKDIYSIVPYASVKLIGSGEGNPLLSVIYTLRTNATMTIQTIFPDPEASLLSGILVGMESSIPPEVLDDFNKTGTTHIIAISGFNITIIAAVLMSFFRRILGTRKGLIAAGLGILTYTILVGGDAAVVRAAIMGMLTLLAIRMGRQTHGFASLSAAALVMTVIDPDILRDVGFQLSFAATLGLMVFSPPLEMAFTRFAGSFLPPEQAASLTKPVGEFVLYTFAAQLMTIPLTAAYFQQLSLSSFIANPVILPAQPLLMITGGIATIVGMISIHLGRVLALIAWPFPSFTIWSVSQFAQIQSGTISLGQSGPLFAIAWYLFLLILVILIYLPAEKRPQIKLPSMRVSSVVISLLLISAVTSRALLDRPDGKLHVTILDVGSGDAVLIQSPTGRSILIDGGSSPIKLSDSLGRRLPLFSRNLDWLILTGSKEDQLGGLAEVVPRFPPATVLLTGPPRTGGYRYFMDQISEAGIPITHSSRGQRYNLAENCIIEVIAKDEQSVALLLTYGNFRMLIAPSADPTLVEELLILEPLRSVSATLLPDGGSELVNPREFLVRIDPELVLISVGAGNSRGLPSEAVLRALEGRSILRTDLNGTIDLTTDGERMWVGIERALH